jgi:hypothetical protein
MRPEIALSRSIKTSSGSSYAGAEACYFGSFRELHPIRTIGGVTHQSIGRLSPAPTASRIKNRLHTALLSCLCLFGQRNTLQACGQISSGLKPSVLFFQVGNRVGSSRGRQQLRPVRCGRNRAFEAIMAPDTKAIRALIPRTAPFCPTVSTPKLPGGKSRKSELAALIRGIVPASCPMSILRSRTGDVRQRLVFADGRAEFSPMVCATMGRC